MQSSKSFLSFRAKRQTDSPRPSRKFSRKTILISLLIGLLVIGFTLWAIFFSGSQVVSFVFKTSAVKKTDNRINILLLGMAGGKHDGALLTDSMIVASFNTKTKKAVLISIPRDLWLGSIKEKVNAAYEIGLEKDDGLAFAEDKIDDILGIPIHYAARVDFSGFERAIDLVDGIDVLVERTFDDFEYPIAGKENDLCGYSEQEFDIDEAKAKELNINVGKQKLLVNPEGKIATDSSKLEFVCRFETLHFNKGLRHLNGELALKFVRSRHGTNNEGSDFARSKRQQLVIESFKSKVLSLETFTNPQRVFGLMDTFGKSFETDIPKERFLEFYNMAKSVESVESVVLGDLGDGKSVFVNPPVSDYGAWVLIPPEEDFSPVVDLVHRALDGRSLVNPTSTPSAVLKK